MTDTPLDLAGLRHPILLREDAHLYLAARDAAAGLGARRFLAFLPAGSAIHPLDAPDVAFLLTSARIGTRAPSFSEDVPSPDSFDVWFESLLRTAIFRPAPVDAPLIEAGQRLHAEEPTTLSARSLLWVRAQSPALSLLPAQPLDEIDAAFCLPVAPDAGVLIAGGAAVTAIPAATLLDAERDAASRHIGMVAGRWLVDTAAEEAKRREHSLARDDRDFDRAVRVIHDTVHGAEARPHVAEPEDDALALALRQVAAAERIEVPPVRRDPAQRDWRERLADISAMARFRTRPVALDGAWWREDGPALIAEDRETDLPRALLPGRGGYGWTGPDGRRIRVTADNAGRFTPDAVMLYPCLPHRIDLRGLIAFACDGIGRDFWRLALAVLAISLLGTVVPVASSVLVGVVVPDGQDDAVLHIAIGLVAVALGTATFRGGSALAQMRIITRVDWRLQAAIWDRVMRLPATFFRDFSVGDLAVRIRAIDDIRRTVSWVVVTGVLGGVLSAANLLLMLAYDTRLGLLGLAYACVLGLLLFTIKVKREALLRDLMRDRGIVGGLVLQLLDGMRKLRVAAAEPRAFARWATAFARQRTSGSRDARLVNVQQMLLEGLPILTMAAAFAIAALRDPPVDLGGFAAFSAAFGQFTAAVFAFASALAVATIVAPMAQRLLPILATTPEADEARADPGPLRGRIALRGVSFRYREDGPWILEDINLDIEPGSFVAIVGPSGSGKSTLLRLLLGFETPNRGSIFYDGHDLARLDLRQVRRQIGTVLQTTGLFPGTLLENIAGAARVSRTEVMEAVAMAGLEDDVATMPMGLETLVSENAATLSGGQRQRVSIARALLRKPRILLFDEATSALDNRTQATVSDSLVRLNATRLVIAHRLSTVRDADQIVVVEGGRVVERGRFDALMERQGAFHRLARRQML